MADTTALKTQATRSFYAGVGVVDLAVETVRDYVAEVSADLNTRFTSAQAEVKKTQADLKKTFTSIDYKPATLRGQAEDVFTTQFAALQELPGKVQAQVTTLVNDNVAAANSGYTALSERGADLVGRIRSQESTKAAVKDTKTTVTKAKTTLTQAKKVAAAAETGAEATVKTAQTEAKKTTATAKKTATTTRRTTKKSATSGAKTTKAAAKGATTTTRKKAATATSSAKATATAAKKAVAGATEAVVEAAEKVGD